MAEIDRIISWRPTAGYRPSTPYDGNTADYVFAGLNMKVLGDGRQGYLENWKGNLSYNESVPPAPVALTGTVSATGGTTTLTGVGTKFTQELIQAQTILAGDDVFTIYQIASDTSLTVTAGFPVTLSGVTAYRVQTLTEVDNLRGNLVRGNILKFPNGNLLTVGDGPVTLNGANLVSPLNASKRITLAIYDPATMAYTVFPLGMAVPALTSGDLAGTGGGVKNMQAGTYGIRIAAERISTGGYNNPSENATVTITAGQRIEITFPAMDTASGQDAWGVYVTLFTTQGSAEGPWYYYGQITTAQVSSAGGAVPIEYLDAEVSGNRLLTFDNDPPPDAGFVATLQGLPILLSCNGPGRLLSGTVATTSGSGAVVGTGTTFTVDLNRGQLIYIDGKLRTVETITDDLNMTVTPDALATTPGLAISLADTTPGPVIRPAKPAINGANVEAFPANFKVAVDPPENIIGWVRGAQGRIFAMTQNYLHLVSSTGNPDLPVTVRPFWRAGFRNPQGLCFVNGTLYGYTQNGPTRSIADGDEGLMEHSFAAPVASIFEGWAAEYVRVAYDPVNECVVYFVTGVGAGATGFRESTALMYNLRLGVWSTIIAIQSTTGNASVTGVATIAGQLVLTVSGENYLWDAGTEEIVWYVATPFMDGDDPGTDKTVTGVQVTAHSSTSIIAGVWRALAGANIPDQDLQSGISPNSGAIGFPQGTFVQASLLRRVNVPRARLFAVRFSGSWDGSGELGRVDGCVIRGNLTDRRW